MEHHNYVILYTQQHKTWQDTLILITRRPTQERSKYSQLLSNKEEGQEFEVCLHNTVLLFAAVCLVLSCTFESVGSIVGDLINIQQGDGALLIVDHKTRHHVSSCTKTPNFLVFSPHLLCILCARYARVMHEYLHQLTLSNIYIKLTKFLYHKTWCYE